MDYLKKFNESTENPKPTLRDMVGDVVNVKKDIIETANGCFFNNFSKSDLEKYLDYEVKMKVFGTPEKGQCGEISLKGPNEKRFSWFGVCAFYQEQLRIVTNYPGEERGYHVFKGIFVVAGNDGCDLWDLATGELDDKGLSW